MSKTSHSKLLPGNFLSEAIKEAAKTHVPVDHTDKPAMHPSSVNRLARYLTVLVDLSRNGVVRGYSEKFIGARLGVCERTVRRAIRDLESLGLIRTEDNYDKASRRDKNTYFLAASTYIWQKGKQLARLAKDALVAATDGATSNLMRRAKRLHNAYREAAMQNLLRGKEKRERIAVGGGKNKEPLTQSRLDIMFQFVRDLGMKEAARCLAMNADDLRQLWEKYGKTGLQPSVS